MTLPRFVFTESIAPQEGLLLPLSAEQAKHVCALRIAPGGALEALLPSGAWLGELASASKHNMEIRLVAPIGENREAPIEIHACLPITAQLNIWADFLPSAVELGATLIQPVIYERSQFNDRQVKPRMERWHRIILAACEQSHRNKVPELLPPVPLDALQTWQADQKWVAYEIPTGEKNPRLEPGSIAFTHGPEGGIADSEIELLTKSGWKAISLGKSILRAATCPAAILGAIQMELGRN
ncbi:MAG: 16S rRNA (uracil(1498)-N(3))-methyltransferase [Holophagales bacterium]|jgi:16S rRNA (uracil1498-N3)-methyltransferase|nr:16S rRNA (uracil(1498)-N(3))-methyltransferase [Holophagales bacterium]